MIGYKIQVKQFSNETMHIHGETLSTREVLQISMVPESWTYPFVLLSKSPNIYPFTSEQFPDLITLKIFDGMNNKRKKKPSVNKLRQ